jgi:hypothetical protein
LPAPKEAHPLSPGLLSVFGGGHLWADVGSPGHP